MRNVLLFRLRFDAAAEGAPTPLPQEGATAAERAGEARPFSDEPPPAPSAPPREAPNPEVVTAKREQANQAHHAIVRALNNLLHTVECTNVEEIPGAIDLWAKQSPARAWGSVRFR